MKNSGKKNIPPRGAWIHSTRLDLILYSMLLVATPMVMIRNSLQQAITSLSGLSFTVVGVTLPLVLSIIVFAGLAVLIWKFRSVTWRHVLAAAIVLLMDAVAQQFADFYSDQRFYDLQQNWHYVAYGFFAVVVYRDLAPRGVPLHRIIILTIGLAFAMSTFDEWFQRYINTRVFDISDIAKDGYGAVAGTVVLALCSRRWPEFLSDRRLRFPRLRDYFRHAFSALVLLGTFSFLLMNTAALLSDREYFFTAVLLAVAVFLLFWMILHLSQFTVPRYLMLGLLVAGIVTQGYFYLRHRHDDIVYHRFGLTVYKGIPIPYFDVLIRSDGSFRLVDKKHNFLFADHRFFFRQKPDILLIGSGEYGQGGNGFPTRRLSQFMYNIERGGGVQVVILKTPEACKMFNRLTKESKNVLFVLHNTC